MTKLDIKGLNNESTQQVFQMQVGKGINNVNGRIEGPRGGRPASGRHLSGLYQHFLLRLGNLFYFQWLRRLSRFGGGIGSRFLARCLPR